MPFAARDDGTRIWFECHGDGPTLVLAHGAGGNRISWWQQVPHFARSHRVVLFDHRGFGRSTGDAFATTSFVDDLSAVLAAADADDAPIAIVGQSMGGWTGLPFALRHPERVRALVLACTPGGFVDETVMDAVRGTPARIAEAAISHTPALGASFGRRHPERVHLYDQIAALNTGVALGAIGRLFDPEARISAAQAAKLAVPTLLLTGSEDLLFPPDVIRAAARALTGSELREVAGAGHSIYFEMPERFNAWVGDFLAKHA